MKNRIKEILERFLDKIKESSTLKVICDETNNSQENIDNNELIVDIFTPRIVLEFYIGKKKELRK